VGKLWGTLVMLVVAAFAVGCGGSTHTKTVVVTATTSSTASGPVITTLNGTSSTTTSTASAATSTTSTAAPVVHLATFKSPTGNIGCVIIAGTARCDIRSRAWSPPPRPHSCPQIVDFGQGTIVVDGRPARLVCAGDTAYDPSARVLPYGTNSTIGAFTCESRAAGMTCTNANSGHGFFISFQSYRLF
jgi:hypothetical protein